MGKKGPKREDTIGSIVKHHEVVFMGLIGKDAHDWVCEGCGMRGGVFYTGKYSRVLAAMGWLRHLDRYHPEYSDMGWESDDR